METVTKKSATEIEIVTSVPEQVIPAKEEREVVSLLELKQDLANFNEQLNKWTIYRPTVVKELETVDTQIALANENIDKVKAIIAEAEKQGVVERVVEPVKEVKEVVEEVKVVEEVIEPVLETEKSPV